MACLRRFKHDPEPGDMGPAELALLYGLMRAEGLLPVFYHDGQAPGSAAEFLRLYDNRSAWFYAAMDGEALLGFGVVNGFSQSGRFAFLHYCVFEHGRAHLDLMDQAIRQCFGLLRAAGLETVGAVLPGSYRWARRHVARLGFNEVARIPGGLTVHRDGRRIETDACVNLLDLRRLAVISASRFTAS